MDWALIITDAQYVLQLGELAVAAVKDAAPYVEAAINILVNKTALTDAQRAAFLAQEAAMRAELNETAIAGDAPDFGS